MGRRLLYPPEGKALKIATTRVVAEPLCARPNIIGEGDQCSNGTRASEILKRASARSRTQACAQHTNLSDPTPGQDNLIPKGLGDQHTQGVLEFDNGLEILTRAQGQTLAQTMVEKERNAAATRLEHWVGKSATTRVVAAGMEETLQEANRMMLAGEWGAAKPRHFVALWLMCHEMVYHVSAMGDLRGLGWKSAVKAAATMLRSEFADPDEMATYIRWTWVREERKEQWCKERGYDRHRRLTWREQFGGEAVADWRLELSRKGQR